MIKLLIWILINGLFIWGFIIIMALREAYKNDDAQWKIDKFEGE